MVFQSTDTRQCVAININDDDILESDKTFILRLETQLDSVVISSPNSRVTIEDNDCKFHYPYSIFFCNSLSRNILLFHTQLLLWV